MKGHGARCPTFFGNPTKIDNSKKVGTLILTSLLEGLAFFLQNGHGSVSA